MKTATPISADEKRWRAEDDLRTLQRADEVRHDRSRLSGAKRLAKRQISTLRKVSGGR